MEGTAQRRTVLVVGDAMIDAAWVMNEGPSPTAQQHGDALPRARATPGRAPDRFGAAGGLARVLVGLGHDVCLLARWNSADDARIGGSITASGLTQVDGSTYRDDRGLMLELFRGDAAVTTIKFRVYVLRGGGSPTLRYRFDQDPPRGDELVPDAALLDRLPEDKDVAAVVVMDCAKGTVSTALLESLAAKYPQAPWFVDTKVHLVLKTVAEAGVELAAVVVNRTELVWMLQGYRADERMSRAVPTGSAAQLPRHEIELDKAIVDALDALAAKLSERTDVVAKLDVDGAAALSGGVLWRAEPVQRRASAAIAAGDTFLASLVATRLAGGVHPGDWLGRARDAAESWLEKERLFWEGWHPSWHSHEIPSEQPDLYRWAREWTSPPVPPPPFPATPIGNRRQIDERFSAAFEDGALETVLSRGTIPLDRGRKLAGSYIATARSSRQWVRNIAGQMLEYFDLSNPRRPLSFLLRGAPGAGKSFLASQLATATGGQLVPVVNASQMATTTELLNAIADVATVYADYPRPILFLDEADSEIGGSHLFALLLSVLWEGQVRVFPRTYRLPRRLVVLCAVSKDEKALSKCDKYGDFCSRLAGRDVTIPAPNDLDRVLLAGAALQRHHPGIIESERGFFDMVAAADGASPRDIESLVEGIRPPRVGPLRSEHLDEDRVPTKVQKKDGKPAKVFDLETWLKRELVRVVDEDETLGSPVPT